MAHPAANYFNELHQVSGVGVPETSGYPALRNLLNAVGDTLKPKIVAVIHPKDTGGNLPDGGLFSAKELRKYGQSSPTLLNLKPERGVVEVKSLAEDITGLEQTQQVRNYLEHYNQILITNYRTFALFSWRNGKPVAGERHIIAKSEQEFWSKVHALRNDPKHPEHERLWQFLRRALLSTARIVTPEDLAAFLASYAREARARIEIAPMGTLEPVKQALSDALGVRFEGEKGTHFFQSTLIQTLFYGIFSAWVLWHEEHPRSGDRFQWRLSAQHLGLPILRTLFVQLAGDPKKVRSLDLEEVLDWTEDCLARVDRASFFARYDMGDAVQYFYEPFLAEFDPELRKDFGVWYTPIEIVRYMVGSVDKALRENFHLADGLADPSVIVLDPCCGTGAFLVETLRLIHRRLKDGYGESQAGLKIREVAKHRLYGFELLPAPYVVSHLQIDLMLTRWGAALNHEHDERAGVFLTNALTGWVPIKSPKDLPFSEFTDERDAADHVKQKEQILVILGNPPYDGHPGMAVGEERGLTEAYRETKEAPPPQGRGLNELYVRFFRMAERRITEGVPQNDEPKPGPPRKDSQGIISYISNYSWLEGHSHTGLRERFMEVFDTISVDCLNGDKFKTGKKTPEGKPDPSIFSTAQNREGIKVGTAIVLLERKPPTKTKVDSYDPKKYTPRAEVRFRHWWGKDKVSELVRSDANTKRWVTLSPGKHARLEFFPQKSRSDYADWPSLPTLMPEKFAGVQTSRDEALVAFDREILRERIVAFYDENIPLSIIGGIAPTLARSAFDYDPAKVRAKLSEVGFKEAQFVRYAYRPLDVRWLFWEGTTKLLHRPSPELFGQFVPGALFLVCQPKTRGIWAPPQVITSLGSLDLMDRGASFLPLFVQPSTVAGESPDEAHGDLFASASPKGPQPNLTAMARAYLTGLNCDAADLFFHIVAVLHSPLYREENSGALRQDWPRVPLPKAVSTLRDGASLGRQLAALLNPEIPVPGVTDLNVRPDLKGLGELAVKAGTDKKRIEPDLAINARWGYAGQGGVTMPGPGKVTTGTRGEGFLDIYLNDTTRWKDVPEPVWNYHLGGYQVLKKWLSYREFALLGRPLSADEAQMFTHNVRGIAAILALHPQLDAHYTSSI